MDTLKQIEDITSRIDQIVSAGDWIQQNNSETDEVSAQTGCLVSVLADDIRKRVFDLITELERQLYITTKTH